MYVNIIISRIFEDINWIWYACSVVAAFLAGVLWYSFLFFKMWMRVFSVHQSAQDAPSLTRSLILQLLSGFLLGLIYFIMAKFSMPLALLMLFAYASLQICNLSFKYGNVKTFLQSIMIEAGYTLVSGAVYILFALI